MGDALKKKFGADIELVAGSNGVFDVAADGKIIFSKFKQGRYPQPEEIVKLIQGE